MSRGLTGPLQWGYFHRLFPADNGILDSDQLISRQGFNTISV